MLHAKARFVLAGILSLLLPACSYGPTVENFAPARRPGGIAATLHLANDSLQAELVGLEADALLVLVDRLPPHRLSGKLVLVPFARAGTGRFEHAGGFRHSFFRYLIAYGRESMEPYQVTGEILAESPVARANLQLLSRYPHGVSEDLLARLEEAYGEIETLDPGGGR